MCLLKVKEEEDYTVPARVKRVTRVRRYEESPPSRVERTYYSEERRPLPPASLPPPTVVEHPPVPASTMPPPSARSSTHIETVKSRRTSRAPSARAPSVRSTTRSHYVEVENSTSSSSSSSEDVRSNATSHHTRKSTRSKPAAPPSEYSIHEREKEIRRERGYSKPEYETYRYVNAPPDAGRSGNYDPRASRESYRRERERIVIEDDYGRRRRDYRR